MIIYRKVTALSSETAVALGVFDGVHRGHRAVISRAVEERAKGVLPVVLTFSLDRMQPDSKKGQKRILTEGMFLERLSSLGVDIVEMPPFESICDLSPERFVQEVLSESLHAKAVTCGENFRFGKHASGDAEMLCGLCSQYGISVIVIPVCMDDRNPVSSTRVRSGLEKGEIETVNRLLGEPYAFDFKVAHGNELGRTIGIPTINQIFDERLQIPRFGVYVSRTFVDENCFKSITNIGVKPSIKGHRHPLAETHIVGVDKDFYGRSVKVELLRFLRPEMKFGSIDELAAQMHADVERALSLFDDPYRRT